MNDQASIFVISDASGNTAEQVVRAALCQFEANVELRVWRRIRTIEEADAVLAQAARSEALLVQTLVNPRIAEHVRVRTAELSIVGIDLMGPVLARLALHLHAEPRGLPGTPERLDDAYFRRVQAMEFTVGNDDGRGSGRLARADIVLVGVSRTSKTPVATCLASRGYRVANVPLVRGLAPPADLFALPAGRVFGLTINPRKLVGIRESRLSALGMLGPGEYADHEHVYEEVREALELCRVHGWPVIDVSDMAVEETASEILRLRANSDQQ